MSPLHRRPSRLDWRAIVFSVLLHAAIVVLVLFGIPEWGKALPPRGPVITGSLVESPTAIRQAEEKRVREKQQKEEALRMAKAEAERKAREEAERKAKEEADRIARAEAERQAKAEAEKKAREAAKKKAKEEAERKARAEAERKAKEEAERKARAEAERKAKAEAERRAKAKAEAERKAREKAAQKEREQALADQLAAEQDDMDRAAWTNRVSSAIQRNWVRPAGSAADFNCVVRIQQSRYGDVLARSIVRSCGNDFLDNSVLEAVDAASPLPMPRNSRVFEATLDIVFQPY